MLKTTSKKEKRISPLSSSYGSLKCKKNVLEKLFLKTYILLKTSVLDIPSFNAEFSGIFEVFLGLPAQRPGTWVPLTNPHLLLWVERALTPLKNGSANNLIVAKMPEKKCRKKYQTHMNCQVSVPSQNKVLKWQSDVKDVNLGTSPRATLCFTHNIPLF